MSSRTAAVIALRAFRIHMLLLSFLSSFVSPLLPLGLGYCWFVATFGGLCIDVFVCCVRFGIPGVAVSRCSSLRVLVFIEFVYWLNLKFASAADPFGGRGERAMSPPRCARLFFLHSELGQDAGARCSVCPTGACSSQLYSAKCLYLTGHRHWSRRPQPRESGGDATLREDTRREL